MINSQIYPKKRKRILVPFLEHVYRNTTPTSSKQQSPQFTRSPFQRCGQVKESPFLFVHHGTFSSGAHRQLASMPKGFPFSHPLTASKGLFSLSKAAYFHSPIKSFSLSRFVYCVLKFIMISTSTTFSGKFVAFLSSFYVPKHTS